MTAVLGKVIEKSCRLSV